MTWIDSLPDRLSTAAAIYRHEGNTDSAVKLEAILSRLDANRPVRVVDLDAADALAWAVIDAEKARPEASAIRSGESTDE